jgi:hypothetical protein
MVRIFESAMIALFLPWPVTLPGPAYLSPAAIRRGLSVAQGKEWRSAKVDCVSGAATVIGVPWGTVATDVDLFWLLRPTIRSRGS